MIDWIRKEEVPAPNDDTLVFVFSPSWRKQHRTILGCYVKLHSDITHWARLGGQGPDQSIREKREEKQEEDFLTHEDWIGAQKVSIENQWDSIQKDLENDT